MKKSMAVHGDNLRLFASLSQPKFRNHFCVHFINRYCIIILWQKGASACPSGVVACILVDSQTSLLIICVLAAHTFVKHSVLGHDVTAQPKCMQVSECL